MDEMKLTPRELDDPPKLVSVGCGLSIEGPEDGLGRLNALLVPAPMFVEVDSKTYISLAPVLRCRWRGQDSKGPWVVRFSMADIGGVTNHKLSKLVSVFRRPTASPDGKWELLDPVDDVDEASGGEETVSVVVNHFSDLIATVKKATLEQKKVGYIVKPYQHRLLRKVRPVENDSLSETQTSRRQINAHALGRVTRSKDPICSMHTRILGYRVVVKNYGFDRTQTPP